MSVLITDVAQQAQDLFYQEYKSMTDFFDIDDFVRFCGNAVGGIYQAAYEKLYAAIRNDKKDEIVGFDEDMLLDTTLTVKGEKYGDKFVEFGDDVFHFMYSNQDVGVQNIVILTPDNNVDIERTTLTLRLAKKYRPRVNRVFWYSDNSGLYFQCEGNTNVKEIRVYYVPKVSDSMKIPDGLVQDVIAKTVMLVKESAKNLVIKKSVDNNDNKLMETEVNKIALKS